MEMAEYGYSGSVCTPEKKSSIGVCGGGEHFVVDDLLDFSNEDEDEVGWFENGGGSDGLTGNSIESSTVTAVDSCSNSFSGGGSEPRFSGDPIGLAGDICEPHYEDLAELEWLSNFVEESFSGVNSSTAASAISTTQTEISAAVPPPVFRSSDSLVVPGKARSKRSRIAPCNWSSRLLVLSPSSSVPWCPEAELITPPAAPQAAAPATVKKISKPSAPKKKEMTSAGAGGGMPLAPAADGRKCLHCQTDKTPQWRTGPMGPKTLCNACGVRYKSGRLVPEYRPAASPTFVLSKHSNSHRKVLELRRQKEMHQQQHPLINAAGGAGSIFDNSTNLAAGGGGVADDFLIHFHIGPDFRQLI